MPGHFFGRNRTLLGTTSNIVFQLLGRFSTTQAAPLGSPYNLDIGQLSLTDSANKFSVSGGQFVCAGATIANSDPFAVTVNSYTRQAGLALVDDLSLTTTATDGIRIGWATSNVANTSLLQHHFDFYNNIPAPVTSTQTFFDPGITISSATMYRYCIVLRSTGAFYFYQAVGAAQWTLLWVDDGGNTSPLYGTLINRAVSYAMDNLEIAQLSGNFTSDYGIATNRKATTVNNDTSASTANAIVEHTITAATGVVQELSVRYVDDNNRWIVRCDQAGSTITLIERNAGVETQRGTAAQTWTNGTTYRIVVSMDGNLMNVAVGPNKKFTYTIANSFNVTATGVKVSNAGTNLVCWPRAVTISGI